MTRFKILIGGDFHNTKIVEIDTTDESTQQIGKGGQSRIYAVELFGEAKVAKIYKAETPKGQLQKRLVALLKFGKIEGALMPEHIILDEDDRLRGYIMSPIPTGFYQLSRMLLPEVRKYLGTRWIVDIFIAIHRLIRNLHKRGIIVGDLSPNNIFINPSTGEILLIDCDSLQFNGFPCPVATAEFLHPSLYNTALHIDPVFSPETDWYSFAVSLFAILFNCLPYDGVHPDHADYRERAKNGIWLLDKQVVKPNSFISTPLTPALHEVLTRFLVKGELFVFPEEVLIEFKQEYRNMTVPQFQSAPQGNDLYEVQILLRTQHPILYSRSTQFGVIALSGEGENLFLTRYMLPKRVLDDTALPLQFTPGMKFECFDRFLVAITDTQIHILDIVSPHPALLDTMQYDSANEAWCVSGGALFIFSAGKVESITYRGGKQVKLIGKTKNRVTPLAMHPSSDGSIDSVVLLYKSALRVMKEGEADIVIPIKLGLEEVVKIVPDCPLLDNPGPFIVRIQGRTKNGNVIKTLVVNIAAKEVAQRQEDFDAYPSKLTARCYNGKFLILIGDLGVYREDVNTGERGVLIQTNQLPQKNFFPFGRGMAVEHLHEVAVITTGKKSK